MVKIHLCSSKLEWPRIFTFYFFSFIVTFTTTTTTRLDKKRVNLWFTSLVVIALDLWVLVRRVGDIPTIAQVTLSSSCL